MLNQGLDCVWVTGANGFIGRHLVDRLQKPGTPPMAKSIGAIGFGCSPSSFCQNPTISAINGAIVSTNLSQLHEKTGPPDCVLHLAGGASVANSIEDPREDFERTVVSSLELLEWARLTAPDTRLVFVSSAAVYGSEYSRAIKETDRCLPFSPYGYNKYSAEGLFRSYSATYDMASTIVRPFSVYGPGLRKQLVFDICNQLLHRPSSLLLHGTGEEKRDWVYIEDLVDILLTAVGVASPSVPVINACGKDQLTVRDVAASLCNAWDCECKIMFSGIQRRGDPPSLIGDDSVLRQTGYRSMHTWIDGISKVVAWHRANYTMHRG